MSTQDEEKRSKRSRALQPLDETRLVEDFSRIIQRTLQQFETADETESLEMQTHLEIAAVALNAWTCEHRDAAKVIPLFATDTTSDTAHTSSIRDQDEKE